MTKNTAIYTRWPIEVSNASTYDEIIVNFTVQLAKEETGYFVTVVHYPEICTQGDTVHEAIMNSLDALQEAITNRFKIQEGERAQ